VLAAVILNVWGLVTTLPYLPDAGRVGDWARLAAVDPNAPYANDFYRWAPPALWLWHNVVEAIGFWPWFALHFVAVAALRSRLAVLLVLLSWPFWSDAINGSTLTFVAVSAALAMRGNKPATIVYIGLFALMPRPLMVPVLAWLLWRRPETRLWLTAAVAVVLAASVISGHFGDWLVRLLTTGGSEMAITYNFAPSAWIGWMWVPIGSLLAVVMFLRGRLGLSSVLASPYWFGYYLLMLVLELPQLSRPGPRTDAAPTVASRRGRSGSGS
jgi:hypothetical protein